MMLEKGMAAPSHEDCVAEEEKSLQNLEAEQISVKWTTLDYWKEQLNQELFVWYPQRKRQCHG